MGYYPQESLYKPYKYHGYTVRGTPNCPLKQVKLQFLLNLPKSARNVFSLVAELFLALTLHFSLMDKNGVTSLAKKQVGVSNKDMTSVTSFHYIEANV